MERNQQESKFKIDRKEQEYRINVAEAKMVETEYLEEFEIDQHLELASSVDRRSDRVNDWVDHALENQKGPEVIPSSSKFATCINTESGSHQSRNVCTAGASPRPSLPNQTLDCDQQCYPYQPTVSFSDDNGNKRAVSTNPKHETQSLPISNNAAFCKNKTSPFLIQL